MKKIEKQKQYKIMILILIVGILMIGGISYAWLSFTVKGDKEINLSPSALQVKLVEESGNLELSNAAPVLDMIGKQGEAFTFYIENDSLAEVNYTLKLVDDTEKKNACASCHFIQESDIRYELVSVEKDLNKIDALDETRIIDSGRLKKGEKNRIKYALKIWLKEAAGNEASGGVFYGKIEVNATQILGTSGIGKPVEDGSGASVPELGETLIPVVFDEQKKTWNTADVTKEKEWYNYEEQRWANAVIVSPTNYTSKYKDASVGTEVKMDDILQMYVWIPRYSYAIQGSYGKKEAGRSDTPTQSSPGEIDVKFVEAPAKNTGDGKYESDTPTDDDWYTPDAFTLGGKELSGLWVGKFKSGYSGASNSSNAEKNTSNESAKVIIKPNVYFWRSINVSNIYKTVKGITNEQTTFGLSSETYDSHVMKNNEWGAVAYLSQSKYGKYGNSQYIGTNKEIYNNNYNGYKTGCSAGAAGASSSGTCTAYDDLTDQGSGKGLKGSGASTTGNIYGIYDMSGGIYEFVMGNYDGYTGSSGFSGDKGEWYTSNKDYINFYTSTNANDAQYKSHAIGETSGWYGDTHNMGYDSTPWFIRSGLYDAKSGTGVFHYNINGGSANIYISFRVVLTLKETA